jgi:hypothetical protein
LSQRLNTPQFRFRHCVVASTTAFEAVSPGSIPGGGANEVHGASASQCGAGIPRDGILLER